MAGLWFLQWTPLISAALWIGLVLYQVARDRFRTWTEVFLLASFFFLGAYALSDFFLFQAPSIEAAMIEVRVSFTCLTLAVAFFLLFGLVFRDRMNRGLLLVFLPSVAMVLLAWTRLVADIVPNPAWGGQRYIVYDLPAFAIWTAYALGYSLAGILALYLTYAELRRQAPRIARRMRALLLAILVVILLGGGTDALLGLLDTHSPPLFASTLAVPAILALLAVSPLGETGLMTAVRHWKSRTYRIKAIFLTYRDGTLIGAKVSPEEKTIDQDLLTGTLDVIQNFMQTSFPSLRDGFLKAVVHGEHRLVIERGRWVYLTLVLEGEETDQLRRQMRDALLAFEAKNHPVLEDWRGVPTEAHGVENVLGDFFSEDLGNV